MRAISGKLGGRLTGLQMGAGVNQALPEKVEELHEKQVPA